MEAVKTVIYFTNRIKIDTECENFTRIGTGKIKNYCSKGIQFINKCIR